MFVTNVTIKNFRCLESIEFVAHPTTVLIGENNVGKTAALDAIKLALGRRWGRSGTTGFNEYDFRYAIVDGQKSALPIEIVLEFAERETDEWPQEVKDELLSIINTDPNTGRDRIVLRVQCELDAATKELKPEWQFLNATGEPFAGAGGRRQNTNAFFDYVPMFSMATLRDASSEFAPRSRLWATLLKTIQVDQETTQDLETRFAELNDELLSVDPKLNRIKATLKRMSDVVATGVAGEVDVRAVPTSLWEILSRAELVVQGQGDDPWLPITRHGNGVQNLAIIFLFRAFVENALAEALTEQSEPILALEEPEAHLHPQATRSLWSAVSALPGQKFVTTHSPYFVQNVPFKNIVLLRRSGSSAIAVSIPREFAVELEGNAALATAVGKLGADVSHDTNSNVLTGRRFLTEEEARELIKCFTSADEVPRQGVVRQFQKKSHAFITEDDLLRLESFSRRIRGEIFFARKWLLCEGPSDHAVIWAVSEVLGCSTDAHGVAIIDYQLHGSAGIFASAARALQFPWALICDGDQGGNDHIAHIKKMSFSQADVDAHVVQLPAGMCLEHLIVSSGLRPLMLEAIRQLDPAIADDNEAIIKFASDRKDETATRLAVLIRTKAVPANIPEELKRVFQLLGEIEA